MWKVREQQNVLMSSGKYLFDKVFTDTDWKLFWSCVLSLFAVLGAGVAPHTATAKKRLVDLCWTTLVMYERVMPSTEMALVIHVTMHLAQQLCQTGPLVSCYAWERFVGWLGRMIGKTSDPEVNAMNCYSTFLWVTERLNVLELCEKLENLDNDALFMSENMICDLFDIASSASTEEVMVLSPATASKTIRRTTRTAVHRLVAAAGAGDRVTQIQGGYRRAYLKGRVLGVAGSRIQHSAYVRLRSGAPAVLQQFMVIPSERRQYFCYEAKPLQLIDQEHKLYRMPDSSARSGRVVGLIDDIQSQIALGTVQCPKFPRSIFDHVPAYHTCQQCQYMAMEVTNFDHY